MKKKMLSVVTKLINRNIRQEADSACIAIGYQPVMPDSVKKTNSRKTK